MMRGFQAWVAGVCAATMLLTGCATQRVIRADDEGRRSELVVTRAGDKVTLSWESSPDLAYSVLFNTALNSSAPWSVVPGLDYIRGTGRMLTYEDHVPAHVNRYYRLRAVPAVSLSK